MNSDFTLTGSWKKKMHHDSEVLDVDLYMYILLQ